MSHEDWINKAVRPHDVRKGFKKYDGVVMFPTTHDICPDVLDECMEVLGKLLGHGNDVLIVSKPHLSCITKMCSEFKEFKDQILFRFTIGAYSDSVLSYWEPGAPDFRERFECLKHAFTRGYKTSISCEPMLESTEVVKLFEKLKEYITDSFWIGKMNSIDSRVAIETEEDHKQVDKIKEGQRDEMIHVIYNELKNEPLVKWKESIKEVVGIETAPDIGMDI
jgi:DNA repair photolyase